MGVSAKTVEDWLRELGLVAVERAEREGFDSWDLLLDGRVRKRMRLTLILDPSLALLALVHFAPPLTDAIRRTYRQMLRWNDELPMFKFALGDEERPVLGSELPIELLSRDGLGVLVARLLAVCDLLHAESVGWTERIKGGPQESAGPAGARLIERYAAALGELVADSSE
ncbi:hypothetical protein BH24CHL5_BH24CHL5_12930 [soil metagenome]